MSLDSVIQTATELHNIIDSDRILVHEHVFNRYPFRMQSKMEEYLLQELQNVYNQGITVICDLTAYTKPYNYYKVIEQSPVKLVSCVGFYTPRYVPSYYKKQDSDTIIKLYSKMIETGIGTRKVKPGILKIAAQSESLSALERKQFYVIAQLNKMYGFPIALHAPKGAYNHVCNLIDYGAQANKIFVAHIETGITKEAEYRNRILEALDILRLGSYIQLADFGCVQHSPKSTAALSFMKELYQHGYVHQILLSADSCWRWKNGEFVVKEYNYGQGKHYTYTKDFIFPLLDGKILNPELEKIILNENPKCLFANCVK